MTSNEFQESTKTSIRSVLTTTIDEDKKRRKRRKTHRINFDCNTMMKLPYSSSKTNARQKQQSHRFSWQQQQRNNHAFGTIKTIPFLLLFLYFAIILENISTVSTFAFHPSNTVYNHHHFCQWRQKYYTNDYSPLLSFKQQYHNDKKSTRRPTTTVPTRATPTALYLTPKNREYIMKLKETPKGPIDTLGKEALNVVTNMANVASKSKNTATNILTSAKSQNSPVFKPNEPTSSGSLSGNGSSSSSGILPTSTSDGATVTSGGAMSSGNDVIASGSTTSSRSSTSFAGGGNNGDRFKRTDERVVISALARLEQDMCALDELAARESQISPLEATLLSVSVLAAALSPSMFGEAVVGVLAPATAAFSASIGVGAEYIGKVAVADGKEIAAISLQCAAEAEGALANAERSKAILPLMVGVSATAATISLLVPVLIENFKQQPWFMWLTGSSAASSAAAAASAAGGHGGVGAAAMALTTPTGTELFYLLAPLISVMAAAISSLALEETKSFCARAIGVGNRRFAKSGMVGRTWLSATEQIERSSRISSERWKGFGWSVLPAPIVGALVPITGDGLGSRAVIVAALGAAQCALTTARAENILARATDAVAVKSRSAAVCDTYANQGARSGAILPYTSAIGALCAAGTAAIVELPLELFFKSVFSGLAGPTGSSITAQLAITLGESTMVALFPTLAALAAAAASVSKARCQVDAEAAVQAASTLALEYDDGQDDPVLRPLQGVIELLRITFSSGWRSFKLTRVYRSGIRPVWKRLTSFMSPA